jgi:TetR/AcrR family transcriptional repressor of bet genes
MTGQAPDAEASPPDRPAPVPHKLSRPARRVQLIESTIETLAARGCARTTLTDVANHARLSHGLVNFHFQTKERLLAETLEYLAEVYRQNWTAALAEAADDPASRLDALLRARFPPARLRPCAPVSLVFLLGRGAKPAPLPGTLRVERRPLHRDAGNHLRRPDPRRGYPCHPARTARALRVLVEGVWLDLITMSRPYGRDEAQRTVHAAAASFFPRHFSEDGLIGAPAPDQP